MRALALALLLCAPLCAQTPGPRERFERAAIEALSRDDEAALASLVASAPWHAEALVAGLLRQSMEEGPDAWTVQAAERVARAHDTRATHSGTQDLLLDVERRRGYGADAPSLRRALEAQRLAAERAAMEGRFLAGLESARAAIRDAQRLNDPGLEAGLLRLRGRLHAGSGNRAAALQDFDVAQRLHRERGATLELARDETRHAEALVRFRRPLAALALHESALARLRETDVEPLADPLELGQLFAFASRRDEAHAWLLRALASDPPPARRAQVRLQLGALESANGRYGPALRELDEAVRAARAADDPSLLTNTLTLRAAVLSEVGRALDAERDLDAAELLAGEVDAPVLHKHLLRAQLLLARGLVHIDAGRPESALAPLGEARAVLDEHGEREEAARARQQEARALAALGWHAEARAAWADAAERARRTGDALQGALALTGLGVACEALGDDGLAEGAFRAALRAASFADTPEARWRARAGLGRLLAASAPEAALCELAMAADDLEDIRAALDAPALRLLFLEDKLAIYRGAALLAARLGRVEEAFRWSESAKARTLRERHAARDADVPAEALAQLYAAERGLAALELAATSMRRAAHEPDARVQLERTLHDARLSRGAARLAAELAAPPRALSLAGRGSAASPAAVAAALPERTALVSYVFTQEGALALVLTRHALIAQPLDAHGPLVAALVERLVAPMHALHHGELDVANLGFDARVAEELYARLVAPLEELLADAETLLVVPDGALWSTPLAALVRRRVPTRVDPARPFARHARHEYLADRYCVGVLPSATLLTRPATTRAPERGGWLAVADPRPTPASAPALPAARREVERLARSFGLSVLVGPHATESAVRARLATAWAVHLAVHATYDPAQPELSRLALAPGGEHDGWLHAFEIEQLPCEARWVVLSACESAGASVAGEGFLGLARAFLVAGAPAVVATHWLVEDGRSALLVETYYRVLPLCDNDRVRALTVAQRLIRREDDANAHPFFWAGYAHVGTP